jgi:hypothetical protein
MYYFACFGVRSAPRPVCPAAAHPGGLLASMAPGRHLGEGTQGAGCGPADVAHDAESTDVGLGMFRGADVAGRAGVESDCVGSVLLLHHTLLHHTLNFKLET